MTRVIVHAGFHKTGTTSLQNHLAQHRAALKPWFDYYGQNDFLSAGARARIYAQKPFFWRRLRFRAAFRRFLTAIPDAPVIVLSRETFSGVMPGHRNWRGRIIRDYGAAMPLCREVITALRRRFGPAVRIEFLFTTRDGESWARSVYGHLLRSIHLREDFAQFRAALPPRIDLTVEAERIGAALAPCPVRVERLEDWSGHRHGPAGIILAMTGVPDAVAATLPPAARGNIGQTPDQLEDFARLNRSGRGKAELKRIKDQILREERHDR